MYEMTLSLEIKLISSIRFQSWRGYNCTIFTLIIRLEANKMLIISFCILRILFDIKPMLKVK